MSARTASRSSLVAALMWLGSGGTCVATERASALEASLKEAVDRVCGNETSEAAEAFGKAEDIRRRLDCTVEVIWHLRARSDEECGKSPPESDAKAFNRWSRCLRRVFRASARELSTQRKPATPSAPTADEEAKRLLFEKSDPPADLSVAVVGRQYAWDYRYQTEGTSSCTRGNPLVLPQGKRVRLLITSDDIVHEWTVPGLGIKADAVPGRINTVDLTASEAATFSGGARQASGREFEKMSIEVRILSSQDYTDWARNALQASNCKTAKP